MKADSLPSFQEIYTAINLTTLKLHPSQVHGLICGILCSKAERGMAWEPLVTGKSDPEQTHEILQQIYSASAKQLDEFLFEFQLVLPDDDDFPLSERAEALTLWCQGFLTGLKLVQIPIVNRDPSESTEAINDLIEIAKMNYEDVVACDEDEAAYTELVEYVRMAVILIFQEMHPDVPETSNVNETNQVH